MTREEEAEEERCVNCSDCRHEDRMASLQVHNPLVCLRFAPVSFLRQEVQGIPQTINLWAPLRSRWSREACSSAQPQLLSSPASMLVSN